MYVPNEETRSWAKAQLSSAGVPAELARDVLKLLETWWRQEHVISREHSVLDLFVHLARSESILPMRNDEVWVAARPGAISVRDQVRVMGDAYQELVGQAHNGRQGVVVAIRSGDVIVRYTDNRQPSGDGVHHSPHKLEKKMA